MNLSQLRDLIKKATHDIDSSDPMQVIESLNILTQKSFEIDCGGVQLEHNYELPIALASLLDTINPLGCFYFESTTPPLSIFRIGNLAEWCVELPSASEFSFQVHT